MSEKRGKRYSVVLSKPVGERVEVLASQEGRSISQMIARLVEECINNREGKQPS
jgi:predicted DNA-binding protein